jgi:hypothetical protein
MLSPQFENFTPHDYGYLGDESAAMALSRKFDGPGEVTQKFEGMPAEKTAAPSEETGH